MRKKYLFVVPAVVFFTSFSVFLVKDKIFYRTQIVVGRNETPSTSINLNEVEKLIKQVQ